jgi:hypothetical protein
MPVMTIERQHERAQRMRRGGEKNKSVSRKDAKIAKFAKQEKHFFLSRMLKNPPSLSFLPAAGRPRSPSPIAGVRWTPSQSRIRAADGRRGISPCPCFQSEIPPPLCGVGMTAREKVVQHPVTSFSAFVRRLTDGGATKPARIPRSGGAASKSWHGLPDLKNRDRSSR